MAIAIATELKSGDRTVILGPWGCYLPPMCPSTWIWSTFSMKRRFPPVGWKVFPGQMWWFWWVKPGFFVVNPVVSMFYITYMDGSYFQLYWLCNKDPYSVLLYNIVPIELGNIISPWTRKPWKMKVLNCQYMGHNSITPKNEGNVGSHGPFLPLTQPRCCFIAHLDLDLENWGPSRSSPIVTWRIASPWRWQICQKFCDRDLFGMVSSRDLLDRFKWPPTRG